MDIFEAGFRFSQEAIAILKREDDEYILSEYNEPFSAMVGFSEITKGKTQILDFFEPTPRKKLLNLLKSDQSGVKKSCLAELNFGGIKKLYTVFSTGFLLDGEFYISLNFRDDTAKIEERKIKNKIRAEWASVFKRADMGMATIAFDDDGTVTWMRANAQYTRLVMLYQKSIGLQNKRQQLYDILKSGKVYVQQICIEDKDLNQIYYKIQFIPILDEEGNPTNQIFITSMENTESMLFAKNTVPTLSHRERQIMLFVAQGQSNRQIGAYLGVSEGTVKKILSNTYRKLDVLSRTQLMGVIVKRQKELE